MMLSLLGGALVLCAALLDLDFDLAAALASTPLLAAAASLVIGLVLTLSAALMRPGTEEGGDSKPFVTLEHYQLSPAARALLSAK